MGVYTNTMRYTGTSGVDVESMVQALMKAEGAKADKLYKQKTRLEWQQNAIRTLGTNVRTFRDSYLTFSSSSLITNMRASSTYLSKSLSGTVTGGGTLSQGATKNVLNLGSNSTVKIDPSSPAGDYKVTIDSVAAKQKNLGSTMSSAAVGTKDFDFNTANIEAGDYLDMTVNGSKKRITIQQTDLDKVNTLDEQGKTITFERILQDKIDTTFGTIGGKSKVEVTLADGKMSLAANKDMGTTFSIAYTSGVGSATSVKTTGGVLDGVSDGKDAFTTVGKDTYTFTVDGKVDPINVEVGFGSGSVVDKKTYLDELNKQLKAKETNVTASMDGAGNITFKSATGDGSVSVDKIAREDSDGNSINSTFGLPNKTAGSGVYSGVTDTDGNFTYEGKDTYKFSDGTEVTLDFGAGKTVTNKSEYEEKLNLALVDKGVTAKVDDNGVVTFTNKDSRNPVKLTEASRTATDGSPLVDGDGKAVSELYTTSQVDLTGTASIASKLGLEKTNLSSTFDVNAKLVLDDPTKTQEIFKFADKEVIIDITEGMTYKQFMNAVSTQTNGKVSLTFNSTSNSFTLASNVAGSNNDIELDSNSVLAKNFNIPTDATTKAADAKVQVTIPGSNTPQTIVRDSNSFTYGGLTFNLNSGLQDSLQSKDPDTGEIIPKPLETTITVGSDTTSAYDNIKGFLAAYNTLLGDLTSATTTTRAKSGSYSFFEPLTEEEKTGLSDAEIEKLEKKAQQGQLYGNDEIERLTSKMRELATTTVTMADGTKMSLSSIGITTGDYSTGGRLYITDEEKLKSALSNNAENVSKLFTDEKNGVAEKLYKAVDDAVGTNGYITKNVGFDDSVYKNNNYYSKLIKDKSTQLSDLNDYLTDKENYYYKMFSYMEQSISNANSQMASLGF